MSPYERAAELYALHPQQESFSHYVVWHSINAFCYSTPDFFIMGRPAVKQSLLNIGPTFAAERFPDTWYIHVAAGNLSKAWSILPYSLPWIAFERWRGGKLDLTVMLLDRMRNVSETPA